MKKKISYLVSHPIQYFSPLFRDLASDPVIDLTVYYCSNPAGLNQADQGFGRIVTWDVPLLDGYRFEFLKNLSSGSVNNKFWSLINLDIIRKLYRDKSQIVIVHGWSYVTNWIAIVAARLLGKQVWLRSENPHNQEMMKPSWLRTIKKAFLQFGLFKLVNRFLYIGTQNRDFYLYYGVSREKLIYAPYCVNNDFFLGQAEAIRGRKEDLKTSLGLSNDSIVILYSGKYIIKKRPMDLLKAYSALVNKNTVLIMVGEGYLRQELENYCAENKLRNAIFTGFVNQSEISKYYGVADIFVLPSGIGETWGLVVNEAMVFGLPVIVSATVGSSVDLVKKGENGFVFREGDIEELTRYLALLVNDEGMRAKAGDSSRRIIEGFTYSVMIENMKKHFKTKK